MSGLYVPADSNYRVLGTWMVLLINPSLHLFLDNAQPWSTPILMIPSHPHPKPSQALSLRLLPIFKTQKQADSPQKVVPAIVKTA